MFRPPLSGARALLGALALTLSAPVAAQEMGLDLSDAPPAAAPAPAPAPQMGLDLSDAPAAPDYRPSVALLGLQTPEGSSAAHQAHAERLNAALSAATRKTDWFARVLDPEQAAAGLGARAAGLRSCEAADCLLEAARVLGVDRVIAAQMTPAALKLFGYDTGEGSVDDIVVEGGGKPGFDRSVALAFKPFLQRLSVELGTLRVVASVDVASVDLPFRSLGTGTVERQVPAGTYRVRVTAQDFLPFEAEVTVEAKGKAELTATLSPKPVPVATKLDLEPIPAEVTQHQSSSKPFYARPGLYLAIVGAAAAAVGLGFGLSASGVSNRAQDPDGDHIYDVTRAELLKAQSDAKLGNILMAAGGAVTLGGVLWFALEPTAAPASSKEPGSEPAVVGMVLHVGGEF